MGGGDDLGPWTLVCTCGHVCVREFICTHHLNSVVTRRTGAFELPSLSSLLPVHQRAIRVYLFYTSVIIINARTLSLQVQVPRLPAAATYVVLLPLILHLFLTPSLLPFSQGSGRGA